MIILGFFLLAISFILCMNGKRLASTVWMFPALFILKPIIPAFLFLL